MTGCAEICAPVQAASSPRSIIASRPSTNFLQGSKIACMGRAGRPHMPLSWAPNPMRSAVAGDSAGANMAAVTGLRVRDEGGPTLGGQLLLYPVTDYHTPGTPSDEENAEGYGLTRDTM